MAITITITGNTAIDAVAELRDLAANMGGTTADPQPAAAREPRKAQTNHNSTKAVEPAVPALVPAATVTEPSGPAPAPSSAGPTATTPASPYDVPIAEADLIAAANAAVGALGPAGAAKVKEYIGLHFKKADGTPGTLKMTAPDQHPVLLKALQGIAQKTITL